MSCAIFSDSIYVQSIYFTNILSILSSRIMFEELSSIHGGYLFNNLLYNYKIK